MRTDEVTPEMVIEAARRIQKRKLDGTMTAKDIWYEINGCEMHSKYQAGYARVIANLIRLNKEVSDVIERDPSWTGVAHYVLKEDKGSKQ